MVARWEDGVPRGKDGAISSASPRSSNHVSIEPFGAGQPLGDMGLGGPPAARRCGKHWSFANVRMSTS